MQVPHVGNIICVESNRHTHCVIEENSWQRYSVILIINWKYITHIFLNFKCLLSSILLCQQSTKLCGINWLDCTRALWGAYHTRNSVVLHLKSLIRWRKLCSNMATCCSKRPLLLLPMLNNNNFGETFMTRHSSLLLALLYKFFLFFVLVLAANAQITTVCFCLRKRMYYYYLYIYILSALMVLI